MPIKVTELNGQVVKMRLGDYRAYRAAAYRDGTMSASMPSYQYTFQKEAYLKGREDDQRFAGRTQRRAEVVTGLWPDAERSMSERFAPTRYGFKWGPCHVLRLVSDPKFGVVLEVKGKRESVEIRITPGGFLRVDTIKCPVDRGDDPEI